MRAPESTVGKVGVAAGVLAAGAAVGAVGGSLLSPDASKATGAVPAKFVGGLVGAVGGVAVASLAAMALAEFSEDPDENSWEGVEKTTALGGMGLLALTAGLVGYSTLKSLNDTAAPVGAPALPASTVQTYTAGEADSGKTLNLRAGDQLVVTLPGNSDGTQAWQWAATPGLVTVASQIPGAEEVTTLVAQAGSGDVKAVLTSGVGVEFGLTLNVL